MKLLVATEFPPNAPGGGPAVVRQMLKEFPVTELSWWSCLPEAPGRTEQRVAHHFCATIPRKLMPHVRLTRAKSMLLERFWVPFATAHLKRTIREINPDAVWAIPHNWSIGPLHEVLPRASLGFHVTLQDYVDVHGQEEKFGKTRCREMATKADELYVAATTRDATSHPMIDDLQERTGARAAQMLHAGLEKSDFQYLDSKSTAARQEIRIAYAGTILVAKEFELFVKAIGGLRGSASPPVILDLFGAHSYANESWFDPSWMREHGDLPEIELAEKLRACTWGLAPMALTDQDPRYNRFSFPTKFISYLAAGLPIIAIGHPESSVMKMAHEYAVGFASSATDWQTLSRELSTQFSEPDPWHRYAAEIKRCARVEFDASRMRQILFSCLHQVEEVRRPNELK